MTAVTPCDPEAHEDEFAVRCADPLTGCDTTGVRVLKDRCLTVEVWGASNRDWGHEMETTPEREARLSTSV